MILRNKLNLHPEFDFARDIQPVPIADIVIATVNRGHGGAYHGMIIK